MRDLALVLWLIGFPLGCALEDYVRTKEHGFLRERSVSQTVWIRGAILIIVAVFLSYRA